MGTRIIFEQSSRNVEYLMWYHDFFSSRGYCNKNKPKWIKTNKKENKIYFKYRVSSYTFTSLNWLHSMFYVNNKKVVALNIKHYLSPLALAIWFMDVGS